MPPLCQYSAIEGLANDWHMVQLGRFAVGGFGLIFTEVTSVMREGRITHGDLGLWSDAHIEPVQRLARFIKAQGAVPAMQLAWPLVGPTATAIGEGHVQPEALTKEGMADIREAFATATRRALAAGYEAIEVHCAHGYLLHQFLSPLCNTRNDEYGGDLAGRMRFPLEIVRAVREAWPENLPLFVRISAVDGADGGWEMADSVAYARECQ